MRHVLFLEPAKLLLRKADDDDDDDDDMVVVMTTTLSLDTVTAVNNIFGK